MRFVSGLVCRMARSMTASGATQLGRVLDLRGHAQGVVQTQADCFGLPVEENFTRRQDAFVDHLPASTPP